MNLHYSLENPTLFDFTWLLNCDFSTPWVDIANVCRLRGKTRKWVRTRRFWCNWFVGTPFLKMQEGRVGGGQFYLQNNRMRRIHCDQIAKGSSLPPADNVDANLMECTDIHYSGSLLDCQWLASSISRSSIRQKLGSRWQLVGVKHFLAAQHSFYLGVCAHACFDLTDPHFAHLKVLHASRTLIKMLTERNSACFH